MKKYFELLVAITSNWKSVLIAIFVTLCVAYYSVNFNNDLPKPETIVEFGKYLFGNTGPYLFGMLLNLLSSLMSLSLSLSFILFSLSNIDDYHPIFLILIGLLGLAIFIVSIYFWRYFFLLLTTFILIGTGLLFVIKNLADSK